MLEKSLYRRTIFSRSFRQIGNKYALVDVLAKRALDLFKGAAPMVVSESKNPHIIAAEEIAAGKIRVVPPRRHDDDDEDGVVA